QFYTPIEKLVFLEGTNRSQSERNAIRYQTRLAHKSRWRAASKRVQRDKSHGAGPSCTSMAHSHRDLNIMQYLEETWPQKPLLPADCIKRSKVREICQIVASGIQPLQNLNVLIYVGEERKDDWAKHWINRGFRALEKLLSSSAGKYCVVFNARRFHVDLRPFPTILRIDRELENHPAFRAVHPSQQPDCPPEAVK
ncbi:hypothetical protein NQ318_013250, partial [Aromia moschata]